MNLCDFFDLAGVAFCSPIPGSFFDLRGGFFLSVAALVAFFGSGGLDG